MLNIQKIKPDFPILTKEINGQRLVYLDNAATSQKPKSVTDSIVDYYNLYNANVHRGSHYLADYATSLYEKSREIVARFIGAKGPQEIIFTRNTTEALNLVVYSYAQKILKKGDEVLIGVWEHHSNLVPWQEICRKSEAKLIYTYPDKDAIFNIKDFKSKLSPKTKIVSMAHASNVLGTIFPIEDVVQEAKKFGATVVVDGAQSVPHMPINVQKLGCDFLAFSGHKMLGPMGVGVLYAKSEVLLNMDPFITGGGMILEVDEQKSSWEHPPYKFEAGTPNVSGAVGLSAAVEYLQNLGMDKVRNHEVKINAYALEAFKKLQSQLPNLIILGPKKEEERTGLISFYLKEAHAHDVSAILDQKGVAVRSGYHCAMPLHAYLKVGPTCRASWYIYNDESDIDALYHGILEAAKILC